MTGERAEDRSVLAIGGPDRLHFLQGLITSDVAGLEAGPVYAALLTPQGKYLVDFLLIPDGARILLDVKSDHAPDLIKRLSLYKLRADVTIERTDLHVTRGLGDPPAGAVADPRDPALGWRAYGPAEGAAPEIDWDRIRVAHCIPETGIELVPGETFILEAGFERLGGVDHRKGCYVGQEVTARMKHKTELRKGFVTVELDGPAVPGDEIMAGDKPAGRLFTVADGHAIAYLRFDRARGAELTAGAARLRWPG